MPPSSSHEFACSSLRFKYKCSGYSNNTTKPQLSVDSSRRELMSGPGSAESSVERSEPMTLTKSQGRLTGALGTMAQMHGPIYIGCAGWNVRKEPADLFAGQGTHLERYASRFRCVEINSSIYRQPPRFVPPVSG
jgi:hypothetical protein